MSALTLKKHELTRRIESIPAEVAVWRGATLQQVDKNAHFSQVRAIEILVKTIVDPQTAAVQQLDPTNADTFQPASFQILQSLVKAQRTWDFFRDKLDLRYSAIYKDALWFADTVAWNCHRTTLDLAVQFGIIDANHLREPPLVYCTVEYSPATWVRGSRPNDGRQYDLGQATLPIPVIELPWDHLGSAWEYLSLHHEVGHDIEADLALRPVLQATLQQALAAANVPLPRIQTWLKWQGEVFADLCALQLGGPAFADALFQLLLLPVNMVKAFNGADPHPTPYVRMLIVAAYVRTLGATPAIQDHAAAIETQLRTLYGQSTGNAVLDAMPTDFPLVFDALMKTALPTLKGHTVLELLPFSSAEDARIRAAEKYFRTGSNKPNALPIRHVPSAARFAVAVENDAGTLTAERAAAIHGLAYDYVREMAPAGLRGGGASAHDKFIAGFAEGMFP